MRLSAENLQGRTVITSDGQAVGAVKSVFIDAVEWRVEAISVELRKETAERVGASHTMFHRGLIEVPVQLIQSVGDTVVLGVAVDSLREARRTSPPDATTAR
jgi:sporulation protein YlmC with PRC-barrel domain